MNSARCDDLTTFDDKAIFDSQFISEIPEWSDTWVNVLGSSSYLQASPHRRHFRFSFYLFLPMFLDVEKVPPGICVQMLLVERLPYVRFQNII